MMTQDVHKHTLPQILRQQAQQQPKSQIALRKKDMGIWNNMTWGHYFESVRNVALGLRRLGVEEGAKVALVGDNNPEMLFMELGVQALGGISVGIYQTSLPDEIEFILNYVDASAVFAEDQEQVDKLLEIRSKIPQVQKVIYEDPRGMRDYQTESWFLPITELMALGEQEHQQQAQLFDDLLQQRNATEVCHFCLTSGTTGRPKAAMLTHKNLTNMAVNLSKIDPLKENDDYVSFLPFAWIGEQMITVGTALVTGMTVNFPEEAETSMEDLKEIGPHVMFGAPRTWEAIRSQVWLKIDESYRFNQWFYHYFMEVGRKAAVFRMRGEALPLGLKLQALFGEYILFRPLRNQLGLLRLRRAYTGGAALGPDLFTFYQGMGVNLKQIYGQTEIIGIAYTHRDGDVKPDTVGLPLPGTECRVSEEGEILSKSDSVFAGYYKRDEATKETLREGWLHSGDAGYLDKDGHLVVIDRLSDVMHTRNGEMFSPMFLENKLKFSPYIKEAVIWGDQQTYISAFINVDPTVVGKWAEDHGISYTTYMDLSQKEQVAQLIYQEVAQLNTSVEKTAHRIKRFVLLYKLLDVDDGELTQTGKLRRTFIQERYQQLIDVLFDQKQSVAQVQTKFQYQDGQWKTVDMEVKIYTVEEAS